MFHASLLGRDVDAHRRDARQRLEQSPDEWHLCWAADSFDHQHRRQSEHHLARFQPCAGQATQVVAILAALAFSVTAGMCAWPCAPALVARVGLVRVAVRTRIVLEIWQVGELVQVRLRQQPLLQVPADILCHVLPTLLALALFGHPYARGSSAVELSAHLSSARPRFVFSQITFLLK